MIDPHELLLLIHSQLRAMNLKDKDKSINMIKKAKENSLSKLRTL